jgi:flagellin-like hook-associated protein FlgL
MSKTTHYELNTPIGSEVLSVMTGLNPNFNTIDETMYDNETRSTQALNKANVNEQNIATALGRITTAEGDIDTLESGLQTASTNISGLTSRVTTAEAGLVSANNRIQENTNNISSNTDRITSLESDLGGYKHKFIEKAITLPSTGNEVVVDLSTELSGITITRLIIQGGDFGNYLIPYIAKGNNNLVSFVCPTTASFTNKNIAIRYSDDWRGTSNTLTLDILYK